MFYYNKFSDHIFLFSLGLLTFSCKDLCTCVFVLFVLLLCLFLFVFFPKQVSYLNVVNFSAKHVLLVHIQVVAWGREKK